MSHVPYPTFRHHPPSPNLSTVGRCRITPPTSHPNQYSEILLKCISQSSTQNDDPKQSKSFMKQSVALASQFLSEMLRLDPSIIDIEVFLNQDDVLESDGCLASCFLDAGASKIVIDGTALEAMECCRLPRERLVAHFEKPFSSASSASSQADVSASDSLNALEKAKVYASAVSLGLTSNDVKLQSMLEIRRQIVDVTDVVVQFSPKDVDDLETIVKELSAAKTSVTLVDPSAKEMGCSYAACARTDREDGLFSTVVCSRNGEALGLVYSSKESIIASLETKRGVYYSRSRNSLWKKGDTSGHYQILHRIDLDCDSDAFRFLVTQKGDPSPSFCHLNTLTCWGPTRGLKHLEEVLKARIRDAPEGSYTKRLFENEELLRDKLVEEAQELSEAVDGEHVAEELADVIYFAMVKATKMDVGIDDAVRVLDGRARKVTRRKGDSKVERIEAGKKILDKVKKREDETG